MRIKISASKSDLYKRKINHVTSTRTQCCSIFPIRENADLERICGNCVTEVKYLRKDGEKETASVSRICLHSGARSPRFVLSRLLSFSLYLSSKRSHVSVRLLVARRNRVEKRRSSGGQIFSRENLSHRKQPSSTTQKWHASRKLLEHDVDVARKTIRYDYKNNSISI